VRTVDLNADLGEGSPGEEALFAAATSVNIACGGHAGDESDMRAALRAARAHGVAAGAHPGYEDRENFGRRELELPTGAVTALVASQVQTLARLAAEEGVVLRHVKPHGALYNQAARDDVLAGAVLAGIRLGAPDAGVFAPAGSALALAAERAGVTVWREAFADRGYLADGRLAPRGGPGATLDAAGALAQALEIVSSGRVRSVSGEWIQVGADTLCVHGDGREAAELLRKLRAALEARGVEVRAPRAGRGC